MSWLPSPPRVLILMQEIEKGEELLSNSSELFWLFCMNSVSPAEFNNRVKFWINKHLEESPKGGGFQDTEISEIILQGPERVIEIIVDKLDALCEKKRVPYKPDEEEDPITLYIYTHIEASRLVWLLKTEQYSERTRETLDNSIIVFNRCFSAINGYPQAPWSQEYSVSLGAVGSFLYVTQFSLRKSDGDYEKALKSLFWGFSQNFMASVSFPKHGFPNPNAIPLISSINSIGNVWEYTPWMLDLDPQEIANCFEAIRTRSDSKDLKEVADICSYFVTVTKNWWPDEEQEIEVKDAKGESWSLPEYWQNALGWVDAQLSPSEFKEIINEREEQAAEQRLLKYFFEEDLWNWLPDRTKSSLISADRDWFSSSNTRIEAILNELKIAVEELLIKEFWDPMMKWFEEKGQNNKGAQVFLDLKTELTARRKSPTILDFEHICRMQITGAYLVEKGVPREDRIWFIQNLQKSLFPLRQARNRAEHESGNRWTREELNGFYCEFVGIGQLGVIKELSKLLQSFK